MKEKIYLDKPNPDIMRNEITTIDQCADATVDGVAILQARTAPGYAGIQLHRGQSLGRDRRQLYVADTEGYLMPIQKDQSAPDPNTAEVFPAGEEVTTDP